MRKHWRVMDHGGTNSYAACGRVLPNGGFVEANPEAVTCGNCLQSIVFQGQRSALVPTRQP